MRHLQDFELAEMGDPTFHRDCPLDCKVYVGNLGNHGNKTELERAFGYYGPLRSVWVARNPPGFAFVEFEDPRDASDAVRELDGRTMCGSQVRVELSTGEKRSRSRGPPPSWNRRPRDNFRRRSPQARRRYVFLSTQSIFHILFTVSCAVFCRFTSPTPC